MKYQVHDSIRLVGAATLPLCLLAFGPAPAAVADGVQVVLAGSHVARVASNGYSVPAEDLIVGVSSGEVSPVMVPTFPVLAADDLNLGSYFTRTTTSNPAWDVSLGDWWDTNGVNVDFFLFEVGGNDAVQVTPRFLGGSLGQPVSVTGWTPTGYALVTGPNVGQQVHGLAFRSSDLRDASGAPLGAGVHLAGVRITSASIDGVAFAAVSPVPGSDKSSDTSDVIRLATRPYKWSPLELMIKGGPEMTELDAYPNPFLDYRLQVSFTGPGGNTVEVPGFFDGDGAGGAKGNVWLARFTPPATGHWVARLSFRKGTNVAVSLLPQDGQPLAFDGIKVAFDVQPVPPTARGFHRKGVLRYVDQPYLRFDDGTWFLKGGVDSPENLLAYFGFDDVGDSGNKGLLHVYAPHQGDWKNGDPLWFSSTTGASSKGLIGAFNYLSSQGVNSVYMLPMNLGGDGQDVCPFVGQADTDFDKTHYDISRLRQWNMAFEHAQDKGILLHFVLAETEPANETWLDNGQLGVQRKLFFREMVARFGHHNAIKWNLCEENDWAPGTLDAFADYLLALDPYDHPIAVHNHPGDLSQYSKLAGDPRFGATSVQYGPDAAGSQVETLRNMAQQAGHPWAVEMDENGPAGTGLQPNNEADLRKRTLWDVYFSGGAGLEWYFGYQPNPIGGDVDAEDFHNRQAMWNSMRIARTFVEQNLPFPGMSANDGLLSGESNAFGGGEVFCLSGNVYAVYFPSALSTGSLNLSGAPGVSFNKRWFNPRSGQFEGSTSTVQGGGALLVGPPPSSSGEDWVLLLKKK